MRAVITGSTGHMGKVLAALWQETYPQDELVTVDRAGLTALPETTAGADVLVDFSGPGALAAILAYGRRTGTPLVIATTGYTKEDLAALSEAARTVPVFYSANTSLGVYVLRELARQAARFLGADADIEIIEKHHNRKKDAPSGTAELLARALEETRGDGGRTYGRHGLSPRIPGEIGIHSVRGGTIVGEHTVLYALADETLEITHRGESRRLFAAGALKAAQFMKDRQPGLYGMDDLMNGGQRNE